MAQMARLVSLLFTCPDLRSLRRHPTLPGDDYTSHGPQ